MQIVSFFSFKGGVGRTALLMSLGARLAWQGRRVLAIDFDLSAPGLSMLPSLEGWIDPAWTDRGAGDALGALFASLEREGAYDLVPPSGLIRRVRSPYAKGWGGPGRLYAIDSGNTDLGRPEVAGEAIPADIPARDGTRTHPRNGRLDWSLRSLAEDWREDLAAWRDPADGRGLDVVFIDCRTGYPELIDLSMGYLADHIVLLSGLNGQNLEGLRITLDALTTQRVKDLPTELSIVLSPVPADPGEETLKALDTADALIRNAAREAGTGAPMVFRLPYWSRLAVADPPFVAAEETGKTAYVQAVSRRGGRALQARHRRRTQPCQQPWQLRWDPFCPRPLGRR